MALSTETAEKILAGARAKASEMKVPMSFAVVDAGGYLIALVRMDGAGLLTPSIATSKAYTAALFRRASAELGKALRTKMSSARKPGWPRQDYSNELSPPGGREWRGRAKSLYSLIN